MMTIGDFACAADIGSRSSGIFNRNNKRTAASYNATSKFANILGIEVRRIPKCSLQFSNPHCSSDNLKDMMFAVNLFNATGLSALEALPSA
jgi:hypothetical protein